MLALRNLRRRYRRTSLTVTGITLAIALTVVMFSLGEGIRGSATDLVRSTGIDLFVAGDNATNLLQVSGFQGGREMARSIMENRSDQVVSAMPVMVQPGFYVANAEVRAAALGGQYDGGIQGVLMRGEIPEYAEAFEESGYYDYLAGGNLPTNGDPVYAGGTYAGAFTGEMVVSEPMAKAQGLAVGDAVYVNRGLPASANDSIDWFNNATSFVVTGILKPTFDQPSSRIAYIHLAELQYMVGDRNDTVDFIAVVLSNPGEAAEAADWIEANYPVTVFTQDDLLAQVEEFILVFEGFAQMVATVTILVALLFTSTVMVINVRERQREVGLMRAIGLSRKTIFSTILSEALAICALGLLIGLALGFGATLALEGYLQELLLGTVPPSFRFTAVTPMVILQASALAAGIGIISGLLPAARASSVNIARTLREE